jgi:hypothetical protein
MGQKGSTKGKTRYRIDENSQQFSVCGPQFKAKAREGKL